MTCLRDICRSKSIFCVSPPIWLEEFYLSMIKFVLLLTACLVLSAQTQDYEYEGPSILSRGGPVSSMTHTPDISFRPYIGINAIYETSFRGVVLNPNGSTQSTDSIGVQGSAGIYGSHHFKNGIIGLNYKGDYQHFLHNSYADNTDQMLTMEYRRQLSKHFAMGLTEVVGTYTRNYLYSSGGGLIDPQALVLPTNDIFDNRVVYGQTGGTLTYRISSRLSFGFGGSGFQVRRRSSSLFGVTGYTANADAAYRLTRLVTISAFYNFQHYEFNRAFGGSDIHMAGLGLSTRLSRTVELALEGGGARVETLFLTTVPIDPVIAAIIGQSTGISAAYTVRYVPTARVRLTKQMHRATAEVSYLRIVTPGNGVYLTSRNEAASASLSYTGQHHWNFSANASYNKMNALAQAVGAYSGYTVGLGVSRDLVRGLHWTLRGDSMRNATNATNYKNFNRNAAVVTMGFYWSPGELPLSLW
jgi:hypothetical protein